MKAAAMDPKRLAQMREDIADQPIINPRPVPFELVTELLADRDHQAERAERFRHNWERANELLGESEARNAAVIAVMRIMDSPRRRAALAPGNEAYQAGVNAQADSTIEMLRVALGLPSEWRETASEPVAKGYQDTPLSADDLVRRAVQSAGHGAAHPKPRWSWVARVFGLGSTSSTALCRRFDLDPDEMRGEYPDDDECDMRDGGEG